MRWIRAEGSIGCHDSIFIIVFQYQITGHKCSGAQFIGWMARVDKWWLQPAYQGCRVPLNVLTLDESYRGMYNPFTPWIPRQSYLYRPREQRIHLPCLHLPSNNTNQLALALQSNRSWNFLPRSRPCTLASPGIGICNARLTKLYFQHREVQSSNGVHKLISPSSNLCQLLEGCMDQWASRLDDPCTNPMVDLSMEDQWASHLEPPRTSPMVALVMEVEDWALVERSLTISFLLLARTSPCIQS